MIVNSGIVNRGIVIANSGIVIANSGIVIANSGIAIENVYWMSIIILQMALHSEPPSASLYPALVTALAVTTLQGYESRFTDT